MRIYQAIPLQVQHDVELDEKASHHVARVMRSEVGEALTLFNGEGGEYAAEITRIDKKRVIVKVLSHLAREVESPIVIHLAQGIAKGEKMDFIVQKAVELGAARITPLITERCNVRLEAEREEKRLQHWRSIAISACEQCGRNRLPVIDAPITLMDWLPQQQTGRRYVLTPHVDSPLRPADEETFAPTTLLIGPEGGLSDAEIRLAMQHSFFPMSLGPRILRAETATIAALTAVQCRFGDFCA